MPTIILTRGLPGSGKSTWARKEVDRKGTDKATRINRDDLRMELLGSYWTGKKEDEELVTVTQTARAREALAQGKDVYIDDTNLNPISLNHWRNIAEEHDGKVQTAIKDFDVSPEECIRRDAERIKRGERGTGPDVINTMVARAYTKQGRMPSLPKSLTQQIKPAPPSHLRPNVVVFDVDGTLCDVRPVRHHVRPTQGKKRNFHAFHMDSLYCPPNHEVVEMMKQVQAAGLKAVVVTAREARYERVTEKWMEAVGITPDDFYMRPLGDHRPDYEVKKDILAKMSKHYNVVHAVDDNPQVLRLWKEEGITTTIVPGFDDPVDPNDMTIIPIDSPLKGGRCLKCNRPMKRDGVLGPECEKAV